jgi:hypothetical protein
MGSEGNVWSGVQPKVSAEAEFFEIVNDFGSPLEVFREAISNAIDAHATRIRISADVREIEGTKRLVLTFLDDGDGMSEEVLSQDFWGLGFSRSRERKDAIGEKGHGTKIYLRSERVTVRTQSAAGAFTADCIRPLAALSRRELHSPRVATISPFMDSTGTEVVIVGYNADERSMFVQDIVRDYILWCTKIGSVEGLFGVSPMANFKTFLKCLDRDDFEEVPFGHLFPEENSDIQRLFTAEGAHAADLFVKRHIWKGLRLEAHPEVTFDVVISVEGDEAKRKYNPMIRERSNPKSGTYRVADKYGIWLCKDYIPIVRVNDWIASFGSGSNAFVLLHGFVNCQEFKLTANRGDIANTDPRVIEELKGATKALIDKVDEELSNNGLYTLREWQEEEKTLKQETADFDRRTKNLRKRRTAKLGPLQVVEPQNESELFGLFITIYSLHPELFPFEPLDYDTRRGIDVIARNRSGNLITEGEFWYLELKYALRPTFNHAFKFLRWIVCWDLDKNVGEGTEFAGIEENDLRTLALANAEDGTPLYYMDNKAQPRKIQVIRLKEFLRLKLGLEFQ